MILEEGNHPYPRCPQCNIFVPKHSLNSWHLETALYRRVVEREWSYLEEEEAREGIYKSLTAYRYPLSQVTSFTYLGRVLAAEDDNWLAVLRNLRRNRQK